MTASPQASRPLDDIVVSVWRQAKPWLIALAAFVAGLVTASACKPTLVVLPLQVAAPVGPATVDFMPARRGGAKP